MNGDFRTIKGYERHESLEISHTMEDYIEMVCRECGDGGAVRVSRLASLLNVRPPSVSKMMAKLRERGLVEFEPYGVIRPTERGLETGRYLLHRHEVLSRFFSILNGTQDELELVERIEHYFDRCTVENISRLCDERRL